MADFQHKTIADLDSAPVVVRLERPIGAPRQAVWDLLALDPSRWADFVPGFSRKSHWVSQTPDGVGSVRQVTAGGLAIDEEILIHEVGARWSFRVVSAQLPLAKALVEDYVVKDAPGGCILHWSVGVWPYGPPALARPVITAAFTFLAGKLASGLERQAGKA
ncbi:MAG TPA: SRPBCC family protein [Pseudonocardia sp.]|jgi:hypothetical protein